MDIHKDNWDALKQKHYSELTTYDAAFIHLSQVPFFELKGCRIASSLWEMQLELNAVSARPKRPSGNNSAQKRPTIGTGVERAAV